VVGFVCVILVFILLDPIVKMVLKVIGWLIGAAIMLALAPIIFLTVFIWEECRASVRQKT